MDDVISGLPEDYRPVVLDVLEQQDPQLLARFKAGHEPSRQERIAVLDILADEFTHNLGPGHEPTPRGS